MYTQGSGERRVSVKWLMIIQFSKKYVQLRLHAECSVLATIVTALMLMVILTAGGID